MFIYWVGWSKTRPRRLTDEGISYKLTNEGKDKYKNVIVDSPTSAEMLTLAPY